MSDIKAQKISFENINFDDLGFQPKDSNVKEYATWIRALMQGWRQGTVGVKDRSEVNRTNKKPWKQKGTGRARAGSARSPLWRGGGVVFGPQLRSRQLTVNKNLKKRVLGKLIGDLLKDQKVLLLDWTLESATPRTSLAFNAIKSAGLQDKKIAIFVKPHDELIKASFVNIPFVNLILFDEVNAFDLSNSDYVLVLKKDLNDFKEMVSRWN